MQKQKESLFLSRSSILWTHHPASERETRVRRSEHINLDETRGNNCQCQDSPTRMESCVRSAYHHFIIIILFFYSNNRNNSRRVPDRCYLQFSSYRRTAWRRAWTHNMLFLSSPQIWRKIIRFEIFFFLQLVTTNSFNN